MRIDTIWEKIPKLSYEIDGAILPCVKNFKDMKLYGEMI